MKLDKTPYVRDHADTPKVVQKDIDDLHCFTDSLMCKYALLNAKYQQSRDENAILKGEKARPIFKPSRMHEDAGKVDLSTGFEKTAADESNPNGAEGMGMGSEAGLSANAAALPKPKRAGSAKRSKTAGLHIDEEIILEPSDIPLGSHCKGYTDFVVQDIRITTHNTRYRLGSWKTPDGRWLKAKPPAALKGQHFGSILRSYILYQHHHCQVTQPLLHEQLSEWGVQISTGQIDAMLCRKNEQFHAEKGAILVTGLTHSSYVTVDDTGTRHQGVNGYVTHIGNAQFAWFKSTASKSRANFLDILHAGSGTYQLNESAFAYMKKQGLSKSGIALLQAHPIQRFTVEEEWKKHLKEIGITSIIHCKIATEGALLGSLRRNGMLEDLAIISDDAPQFKILIHGLCWVHAERLIHKLFTSNAKQREEIAHVRDQIWDYYEKLKAYKLAPDAEQKIHLEKQFDHIFMQDIDYPLLAAQLERLHKNKDELLLVLMRPEVPLHTNGSECDIRDYVKKQKVSGGTRSDLGRKCRDTFASLKKTCRKLGISFWEYLIDRISCSDQIPPLQCILEQRLA